MAEITCISLNIHCFMHYPYFIGGKTQKKNENTGLLLDVRNSKTIT